MLPVVISVLVPAFIIWLSGSSRMPRTFFPHPNTERHVHWSVVSSGQIQYDCGYIEGTVKNLQQNASGAPLMGWKNHVCAYSTVDNFCHTSYMIYDHIWYMIFAHFNSQFKPLPANIYVNNKCTKTSYFFSSGTALLNLNTYLLTTATTPKYTFL